MTTELTLLSKETWNRVVNNMGLPHTQLVGMLISAATMENSLEVP